VEWIAAVGDNEISGIGGFHDLGEHYAQARQHWGRREEAANPAAGDRVELTAPDAAALALLRQRVLAHTLELLALPALPPAPRFCELGPPSVEAFLGRLWGEQARLGCAREGEWPQARIDAALREAMTRGVEDALQILGELDQLDAPRWRLLCTALTAWVQRIP
jgi:hypothetical protein